MFAKITTQRTGAQTPSVLCFTSSSAIDAYDWQFLCLRCIVNNKSRMGIGRNDRQQFWG
jgi:hypothetical protein